MVIRIIATVSVIIILVCVLLVWCWENTKTYHNGY
jgi:hypothetical protein